MIQLAEKLGSRQATAAVIGLGYVGLPLAMEVAQAGFNVIGIDVDQNKINALKKSQSYILDVPESTLTTQIKSGRFTATEDFSALAKADTVSICVPTPLSKSRDPDISFIFSATEEIRKYLHAGQFIVLESTTYPGTTDELIVPELESSGLQSRQGFFPRFFPRTNRSGQYLFQHPQHSENRRRHHSGVH